MFTTRCFIRKNTPELRQKLEGLGYKVCVCCTFSDNVWLDTFIWDEENRYEVHGVGSPELDTHTVEEELNRFLIENYELKNPIIDCGENEELFLALAALRDDKPDYQWFVWDDDGVAYNKFKQYIPGEPWQDWWWFEVHKATVEELIEHFK